MSELYAEIVLKPSEELIKTASAIAEKRKKEILLAVRNVHRAWLVMRQEGLLMLEEQAKTVDNPYYQRFCTLVVDATHPENLKRLMENAIALEPDLEEKYFAYFYANAFLLIQTGMDWNFFQEYMMSLLPAALWEEYRMEAQAAWREHETYWKKFMEERAEIAEEIFAQAVIVYECDYLEACEHKIALLEKCREYDRLDAFLRQAGQIDGKESLEWFLLMCRPGLRKILLSRFSTKERTRIQHRMLDKYENYKHNWVRKEVGYFGILERMEGILYEV